jgi:hypothetical protein
VSFARTIQTVSPRVQWGKPTPNGIVIPQAQNALALRAFFGVDNDKDFDLLIECKVMRHRLPSNMVPIAEDGSGNCVALCVAGRDVGAVYFWDHELEVDEGSSPTHQNLFKIADDFDTFLNKLQDLPEVELAEEDDDDDVVWFDPEFYQEQVRAGNTTGPFKGRFERHE